MSKNNQYHVNYGTASNGRSYSKNRRHYKDRLAKELPVYVLGIQKDAVLDNYDPPVCIGFSDGISECGWNEGNYHIGFYVTGKSEDRPDVGFPKIVEMKVMVYGKKVCFSRTGDIANCNIKYNADTGEVLECIFDGQNGKLEKNERKRIEEVVSHVIHLFGRINCKKKLQVLNKINNKNLKVITNSKQKKGNRTPLDINNKQYVQQDYIHTKSSDTDGNSIDAKKAKEKPEEDNSNSINKKSGTTKKSTPVYKMKYWVRQNAYNTGLGYSESCICSRHCLAE